MTIEVVVIPPYLYTVWKNGVVNEELEAIDGATSVPSVCPLQDACESIHEATVFMENSYTRNQTQFRQK
jgi:hypothetical protein